MEQRQGLDTNQILDRIVETDAEICAYCAQEKAAFEALAGDLRARLQEQRRLFQAQSDEAQMDRNQVTHDDPKRATAAAAAQIEARFAAVQDQLLKRWIETVTETE